MLHTALLHLHKLTWWIVLISGIWTLWRVWRGQLAQRPWTRRERMAGLIFSSALGTQALFGLTLYFLSETVRPLFGSATAGPVGMATVFFGLIHPMMMITAAVVGQAGYSVSKRLADDRRKYSAAVACYTVAVLLVLMAVPWPFLSYGRTLLP